MIVDNVTPMRPCFRNSRLFGVSLLGLLMAPLVAVAQPAAEQKPALQQNPATEQNPAAQHEASGANPRVSIMVSVEGDDGRRSDLGKMVIELYPNEAPRHTENFLKLAREGFYTGLTFHRIVPAFVIQGGDPMSRSNWQSNRLGTGGPGYNLPAEISRKHMRGAVAAARKNDPTVNPNLESSGSQFYICLADLPSLDRAKYTVFGQVVEGLEVVDSIARVKNTGPQQNQALQRVTMTQVRVLE